MIAYKITCAVSNKVYIGITRRSIKARWSDHRECVGNGKRGKLYSAMRKHGIENFTIEHVASAKSGEDLQALERQLIAQHNSFERGYNMTIGGDGPTGMVVSTESRERMRLAHLGKRRSPETNEKCRAKMLGRKMPPRPAEWSAKISAANKGRPCPPERREKMREIMKGRKFTPEWRAKISAVKKERGQGPSPEQAAAHSLKMRGRKIPPRSAEHQAKLNAAMRAFWARRRAAAAGCAP